MYTIARFGPIEVGRVTTINQPIPYYATINAVAAKPTTPQLPESTFRKAFSNYNEAKAFVTSYFPEDTQSLIQWTIYN
jgi:hypothetical protein